MEANVLFKTTVDEATTLMEALEVFRKVMIFNMNAIHANDDERKEASRKFFHAEGILRRMGREPLNLTKADAISAK